MSAIAASLKREADASSSAAAKRARHDDDSAEAAAASRTATDPCVAETEAAATQINAGVIKKLTIKRIDTMMLYLPPFCAQNFMGIEHFAATMAPGINILQGDDGSAVLQPIRFCLSSTYELTEEQIGLVRLLGQQGATALQIISDAGQRITCDKAEQRSWEACLQTHNDLYLLHETEVQERSNLVRLTETAQQLFREHELYNDIDERWERVKTLTVQLEWAQFAEAEGRVTSAELTLDQAQHALQHTQAQQTQCSDELSELQAQQQVLAHVHTEREQQQEQAQARVTAAQQQLQTVTLQLHSEQTQLAQRLHELAHTAHTAALAAATTPVGYGIQVQPVELAMAATHTALAHRAQYWQQSDAQLQAARAQHTAAVNELQAAQASAAAAAGNHTQCCDAVTHQQQRMPVLTQRVTQQTAAVNTAQQHVAAMQAAAAQQLQHAEHLQQCHSGGEWNGERVVVAMSAEKIRRKIQATKEAVARLALEQGIDGNGASAALQQQLLDAETAYNEKSNAIATLQRFIKFRSKLKATQMSAFHSWRTVVQCADHDSTTTIAVGGCTMHTWCKHATSVLCTMLTSTECLCTHSYSSDEISMSVALVQVFRNMAESTFQVVDELDIVALASDRKCALHDLFTLANNSNKQVLYMTSDSSSSMPAVDGIK
eukprot:21412-Heterococcus_DN1.PRE.1